VLVPVFAQIFFLYINALIALVMQVTIRPFCPGGMNLRRLDHNQ
jgi:hypothetical protein